MQPLSALEIVQVWEWGQDQHPVDRALALLALALPELHPAQVAELSVGQRNLYLLTLRGQMFGPRLNGCARCAQCGETLEFAVEVNALLLPAPEAQQFHVDLGAYALDCRLPNSQDLAAVVGCGDVEIARQQLIRRCVLGAWCEGQPIALDSLPETVIASLGEAVAARDPQAQMSFALECPACRQQWSARFDIVPFLWTELGDRVRQLLYDVHLLAQAYGWSEGEILALSRQRRQTYLEWVVGER